MGMLSMNLQVQLAEKDCESKFINEQILSARSLLNRDLNQQEQAIFNQELNRLLLLRKRILDDLREKKKLALLPAPYAANHETELNRIVNDLLKNNPNYEAPEINKDTVDPNTPEGALKGIFSKITGAIGMDKGPFAFIAQLLEKLFSFIFPMINSFKEMGETMKEKAYNLFHKGKYEDAEVSLKQEERSGFEKVIRELNETIVNENGNQIAVDATQLLVDLNTYRTELAKFEKKDLLDNPALSEEYRLENLQLRIDEFKKFENLGKDFSKLHEAEMRVQREIKQIRDEETKINQRLLVIGIAPTENAYLQQRLLGVQAELHKKTQKKTDIVTEERNKVLQFTNGVQTINGDFGLAKVALNAERTKPAINLLAVP